MTLFPIAAIANHYRAYSTNPSPDVAEVMSPKIQNCCLLALVDRSPLRALGPKMRETGSSEENHSSLCSSQGLPAALILPTPSLSSESVSLAPAPLHISTPTSTLCCYQRVLWSCWPHPVIQDVSSSKSLTPSAESVAMHGATSTSCGGSEVDVWGERCLCFILLHQDKI